MGYFNMLERILLQDIKQGEGEEKLEQHILQMGFFNHCFVSQLTRSQHLWSSL
jgi:hypothetical protein